MTGHGSDRADAKRTVLIVEDNEINREMLAAILEDDYNVIKAEDGLVGLAELEGHYKDISVILLDVHMPNCDGLEFLRRKREDERYDPVPVIVATASSSAEDEIRCLELGANDFVVKPYNIEIMMNRINNIIRLRESASIVNQLTWDAITGLYSKEFFYRNVEDAFKAAPDAAYDIVCSDIDNFKALNDRYGAKTCDLLLRNLADCLMEMLPGPVVGGRIGGDTFAFLIGHQPRGWERAMQHVPARLQMPHLSLKFGVVENVEHDRAAPLTCDRAIIALEEMKGTLGVGVSFYDEELSRRQATEQTILDSMEAALAKRQFSVFYQPKHDVRAGRTGGAEALARWIHPQLGFVSPGVFIPIFERNGFITKLDLYIWEEACRELRRCMDAGLPVVPVSVNASRLDFDLPDLAQRIAALADAYGIDHSMLHVELTETAYADDPELVINALRDLRDRGFSVELDDFGSGYSSLSSLNVLPLDVMKLDMSLIRQATRLGDFRIVQSTLKLAQILGLKTVVEGVESADEVERLRDMGCDLIQGYYYSKPLEQGDFERYLAGHGQAGEGDIA